MHHFTIEIEGIDRTAVINKRFISLELTDKQGLEADELTITLSDHDSKLPFPTEGNVIKIWLGITGTAEMVYKGSYTIDEAEHSGTPDQMTIRAKAADMKSALKAKRSESYHQTTLGAIANAVASRHSLTPMLSSEASGIMFEHIDQTRESDLNLLSRLAKQNDLSVSIKNGHLIIKQTSDGKSANGNNLGTIELTRASGDQHLYRRADRTSDYKLTIASWRDRSSGKIKHIQVNKDGSVSEITKLPEDKASVITKLAKNKAEATKIAKAKAKQQDRKVAEFELTLAALRPDILADQTVKVSGFRPYIDAHNWRVIEARHTINASVLSTKLIHEAGLA